MTVQVRKIVHGGAWIYGRTLFTHLMNVGVVAILARQLSPEEFGVVALARVILRLLTVLGTEGVVQFIVYDNEEGREERSQSVFWLDLTMSTACALLGILCLPLVTWVYPNEGLQPLLLALLISFPINSLSKVPDALLRKTFEFKRLEIRESAVGLVAAAMSVSMALTGWGAWSLVVPGIVASVLRAAVMLRISRWRPALNPHFEHWPRIFSFHASIMGSATTSFIISEGDTLLIGRVLGSAVLGIYSLAWQAANLVNRSVVAVATKLALPTLSAVGDQANRGVVMTRMMGMLGTIAFPLLVGMFVVADDFVLVVYGPQWEEAVLPLRILLVYALRYAVNPPIGAYFQAIGRPDVNFKLGVSIVPFYLAAIWLGSRYGIVGIAAGVTIVRTGFGLIAFEIAARFIGIRFRDVVRPLVPALTASCLMGTMLFLLRDPVHGLYEGRHVVELLALIGIGGVLYVLIVRTLFGGIARDLAKLTAPILGHRQPLMNRVLNIT